MLKEITTERRTIKIMPYVYVKATICNDVLAYHPTKDYAALGAPEYKYTLTHVPTTGAMAFASSWQRCRKAAEELLKLDVEWHCSDIEAWQGGRLVEDWLKIGQVLDRLIAEGVLSARASDVK